MTDSFDTVRLHQQIERIQAGDSAAQEELVRAITARMERMARAMLRGFPNVRRWADTEDVFQSAMMRLLVTLRQLTPASTRDFYNLAAAHVRRELLDLARRFAARRQQNLLLAGQGRETQADALGALADEPVPTDRLEVWCRLHEAIEALPVEECETVGLVFYHGWEQKQIAEVFGVSERTVRRYWRSGCRRLAEALGDGVDELLG